jgi:hypothetical protein
MPRISSEVRDGLPSVGRDQWRACGGREVIAVHELQIEDMRCVFRLREPSGDTVIAKYCPTGEARREETLHHHLVHRLPFPVLRCLGRLDAAEEGFSWLFLEDGGTQRFDPGQAGHRRLAGTWLGKLHVAGTELEKSPMVRSRGPDAFRELLDESAPLVAVARGHSGLGAPEAKRSLDAVESACARLMEVWEPIEAYCRLLPQTAVHGDFKEDNVCLGRRGEDVHLLVFDWNEAGWGPPALDLAKFRSRYRMQPELGAYLDEVRSRFPSFGEDEVEGVGLIGEGLRAVACIRWELEKAINPRGYCSPPKLSAYAEWIELLLQEEPWLAG